MPRLEYFFVNTVRPSVQAKLIDGAKQYDGPMETSITAM